MCLELKGTYALQLETIAELTEDCMQFMNFHTDNVSRSLSALFDRSACFDSTRLHDVGLWIPTILDGSYSNLQALTLLRGFIYFQVAVFCCDSGKARSGVMICAMLIAKDVFATSRQAIEYFNRMRGGGKDCKPPPELSVFF